MKRAKTVKKRASKAGKGSDIRAASSPRRVRRGSQSDLQQEIDFALAQQKATAEILQIISRTPGDLGVIFQAILENATRICDAKFGILYLFDGHAFQLVEAAQGTPAALVEFQRKRGSFVPAQGSRLDRIKHSKQMLNITDAVTSPEVVLSTSAKFGGARSMVGVPMLKGDVLIGVISSFVV